MVFSFFCAYLYGTSHLAPRTSQLKLIVRAMYSSPPIHGARIVGKVLSNPVLKAQWYRECKGMADRYARYATVLLPALLPVLFPVLFLCVLCYIYAPGLQSTTGLHAPVMVLFKLNCFQNQRIN
jgi:aspartate/tyrosine/aromatic aminotransferase